MVVEEKKIRVVAVDDHRTFLDYVDRFLTDSGRCAVVGTCESGFEAIETVREQQPDVVLVDIRLKDGLALIPALHAAAPHARFIVVTVNEAKEYEDQALASGAETLVPKRHLVERLVPAIISTRGRQVKAVT